MTSSVTNVGSNTPVVNIQAPAAQGAVDVAAAKITGISSQITSLNETLAIINQALAALEMEKAALKAPSECNYWKTETTTENGVTTTTRVFDSARYNADMTKYLSALQAIERQVENLKGQATLVEQQLAQKDHELQQAKAELDRAQKELESTLQKDTEAWRIAQQHYQNLQRLAREAEEQLLQAQANAQRAQDALEQVQRSIESIYETTEKLAGVSPDAADEFRRRVATWKPGDPPAFAVAEPVDPATLTQASKDIAAADTAIQTHLQNATAVLPTWQNGELVPPKNPLTAQSYYELMPKLASFENGLHNADAGLLLAAGTDPTKVTSESGAQLINAWLEAGFSLQVATKALEAMVGGERAEEILATAASPNGPLADRNLNQFIPDDVLNSGDPDAVHDYITDTNNVAYQDEIDAKNQEIADAQAKGASAPEIAALQAELTVIETTRDTQTQNAIAQFDQYYNDALAVIQGDVNYRLLTTEAQQAMAVADAGDKYNDWVFYYNSEGQKPAGPTTLFATGDDDSWPIELNDIDQGYIGDCYFMASIGAIAQDRPELIERMITDNGDGTYTVTFHQEVPDDSFFGRLFNRTKVIEVPITVDLTMPSNGRCAEPSGDVDDKGAAEIWPQVLEKAWATYQGSYGAIDGGYAGDVLFAITGEKTDNQRTSAYSADRIEQDLDDNKAVVMDTVGIAEADRPLLATYDLVEGHSYTVKGIRTDADGTQYVILYNPWGADEQQPKPIPFEDAKKLLPRTWVN